MVYITRLGAKLFIAACCFLCSINFVDGQESVTQLDMTSQSGAIDFGSLGARKDKLSTKQEKAYSSVLSKLYSERLKLMNSSQNLEAKLNNGGNEPSVNTKKELTTIENRVARITADVEVLTTAYEKNTTAEQLDYIIQTITRTHFPQSEGKAEKEKKWNEEFSYLEKEISGYEIDPNVFEDCQIIFNGIDPNSLQKKVQTSEENLISYTHPKLESYYKEESFLTGDVSLVKLGKDKFVVMDIIVRSRDAIKNYGMIQIGSPLKFELINGESAYLFAAASAEGRPVPQTSQVRYQVLYYVNKNEYKQLRSSEIDNVGIMWTSGYEKYDVYNLDVLQRQIECIEPY